jgi:mono/diheme cytochrome c family protein
MRRGVPIIVLAGVAALAGAGCRGQVSKKPPIHFNQNMDQQRRFDAQEPNPFFADGRAMRPRVAGTVPYGSLKADDHLYRGKAGGAFATTLPQRDEQGRPLLLDMALLERGRERYTIYCQPCHDAAGTGNGVVVERGMMQPPSFHDERIRALPVGQLVDIIGNGVRNMPSYAAQVRLRDRWAIAVYVRALQVSHHATLAEVPADVAAANRWEVP